MKRFNKMKNINKIDGIGTQFWNKKKKLTKLQQKLAVVNNTYKLCESALFVCLLCIAYSVGQFSYPIKYEKFAFIPFYLAVDSRCLFCFLLFCYFVFILVVEPKPLCKLVWMCFCYFSSNNVVVFYVQNCMRFLALA